MESIIFDYIGYVFVFCAAFCVAAPILLYLVSLVVAVVWKVIDEGDSEPPYILKKIMPFLWTPHTIVKEGGMYYIQRVSDTRVYDRINKGWSAYFNSGFDSDINARNKAESMDDDSSFNFRFVFNATAYFFILGVGFILIPTITMYALSSALCLLSLRWSRRVYKKVKKLKVSLDNHTKDKEAHK